MTLIFHRATYMSEHSSISVRVVDSEQNNYLTSWVTACVTSHKAYSVER